MTTNQELTPIKVEYVWIGGEDKINGYPYTIRSKTRVIYGLPDITLEDCKNWDYDGSSTGQATTDNSEVVIIPRRLFNDPFRGGKHKLVLCDTYYPINKSGNDYRPHDTNTRYSANQIFSENLEEKPWFGVEQEFFLLNNKTGLPLGFPADRQNSPNPQGQYYCSVGSCNAIGRNIVDEMMDKAVEAGIRISGMNAEVALGQWELQVGPCEGIESGDHVWMLRYIMERVTEKYDCHVELHPKPLPHILGCRGNNWNGSGCHVNFSTKKMRDDDDAYATICSAIDKLSEEHKEHLMAYGEYNDQRLTGQHETSSMENFSYGVGNRAASIRIPTAVALQKCGYFEDRRPSSNMDPYLVTSVLFRAVIS